MDLTAISIKVLANRQIACSFGLAFQIPPGHVGLIFPRSSVVRTDLRLANAVGVIDQDFVGEISAVFDIKDTSDVVPTYHPGDRVAQLVIMPVATVELEEVYELEDTERGTGGYGSTNVEGKAGR